METAAVRDMIQVRGSFELIVRDKHGQIKASRCVENLVVNAGLAFLAGALSGDEATPDTMKYIGIGTNNTAAQATDTTLGTEVETRATGSQSRITDAVANDTYQCDGTITATAPRAVVEAALFDASSNGTMLCRQVFSVVNLSTDDSIQITWQITFA